VIAGEVGGPQKRSRGNVSAIPSYPPISSIVTRGSELDHHSTPAEGS
jgi:hypothetical protein